MLLLKKIWPSSGITHLKLLDTNFVDMRTNCGDRYLKKNHIKNIFKEQSRISSSIYHSYFIRLHTNCWDMCTQIPGTKLFKEQSRISSSIYQSHFIRSHTNCGDMCTQFVGSEIFKEQSCISSSIFHSYFIRSHTNCRDKCT